MMKAEIKKGSEAIEFDTKERCSIAEIANDPGDEWVSVAKARVSPGVTTAWHKLKDISERYIIIAGIGKMEIGNLDAVMVYKGDVIRIPKNTPQRITNIGATDLLFYAVCSPRFKPDAYISLE
jgi:mannose-6-phosphate isomerase-like protein (cupin superfamily)